jgi:hypothetical protein
MSENTTSHDIPFCEVLAMFKAFVHVLQFNLALSVLAYIVLFVQLRFLFV